MAKSKGQNKFVNITKHANTTDDKTAQIPMFVFYDHINVMTLTSNHIMTASQEVVLNLRNRKSNDVE